MITLPLVPATPSSRMRCPDLHVTDMAGSLCVYRQRATVSIMGSGHRREVHPDPSMAPCSGGHCAQGLKVLAAIGGAVDTHGARQWGRSYHPGKRAAAAATGQAIIARVEARLARGLVIGPLDTAMLTR